MMLPLRILAERIKMQKKEEMKVAAAYVVQVYREYCVLTPGSYLLWRKDLENKLGGKKWKEQ